MTTLAVSSIATLVLASAVVFGINQFYLLKDQNEAQENLILAAFYLRTFLAQGVKVSCYDNQGANPAPNYAVIPSGAGLLSFTAPVAPPVGTPTTNTAPLNVPAGIIDCRPQNDAVVRWQDSLKNPVAQFYRETGTTQLVGGLNRTWTTYTPTAIFFEPPQVNAPNASGRIYFASQEAVNPAAPLAVNDGTLWFDKLTELTVIDDTGGTSSVKTVAGVFDDNQTNRIRAIALRITTRYFLSVYGTNNYTPESLLTIAQKALMPPYRDTSMTVNIVFRNNILGENLTERVGGRSAPERPMGGLYFFSLAAPPLSQFQ